MAGRWALLVDAGWFFAASSDAVFGTVHPRARLRWDVDVTVPRLVERAKAVVASDAELLRTYWYDGSRNRLPEQHHLPVARADDVKLRLGRTTSDGQKGVDGLIIHDLIMLSLQGHISDAVVISGDEDLLEAVESAQRSGTRVHLLEVRFGGVSQDLLRAFDRRATLDAPLLRELIHLDGAAEPASGFPAPPESGGTVRPFPVPPERPAWLDEPLATGDEPHERLDLAEAAARRFARDWLMAADESDHLDLLSQRPILANGLDGELLRMASGNDFIGRWLTDDERVAMRESFWSAIASGLPGEPPPDTADP